jgi:hypothetical protein
MQAMRRLKLPCDDITPIGLWGSDMYLIGVNNEQFEVLRLWNVQTEDITPATLRDFHTDEPAIPTTPSAGNAASDARYTATEAPKAAPPTPASAPAPEPSAAPEAAVPKAAASKTSARAAASAPQAASAPAAQPRGASAGTSTLDITPAIAAVVQSPAPEAPTLVRSDPAPESGRGNGSAGAPSVSERRDGPALTLESNIGSAARGAPSEEAPGKRGGKAQRGDTEARPAPAKESKDKESSAGKLRMTVDGEHLYAEIKGGKIVLKDRTYDSLAHARDSIRRERNKVAVWEYFDEGVKAWRVLNRD